MKTYKELKAVPNYASTGSLLLDLAVGGGMGLGYPYGRVVNVVGDKSAGKSFLAMELIAAELHKRKGKLRVNYDDAETGCTFDTKTLYDIDLEEYQEYNSDVIERFDGNTQLFMDSVKPSQHGIYCLDSLDGLSDKDTEEQADKIKKSTESYNSGKGEGKKESGSYKLGTPAHLSKQYFKALTNKLAKRKVLLMIVSQIRMKLNAGMFEKPTQRAGGKALDFYAHTCLWLYTAYKIKKDGLTIGVIVKAVTEKSKTPRPFRQVIFPLYFTYGIDDIGSCVDFLFDLRGGDFKLTKAKNEIPWAGDNGDKPIMSGTTLKAFLEEKCWYKECLKTRKEEEGKGTFSFAWGKEWLDKSPEKKKVAEDYFAKVYTRAELIEEIEKDPDMKEELYERVVQKWEEREEAAIAEVSCRQRKYR